METLNAKRPLKRKLIQSTLAILLISFSVASVLVFIGIDKIGAGIVSLVSNRSEDTTKMLNEFSTSSTGRIRENFTQDIRNRSLNVLKKDSGSLVQLFQDNSFLQVKEFVQNVFKDDKDILRAAFFVYDGKQITGWHYVDRNYPQALDMGTEFNLKTGEWVGKYKGAKVKFEDPSVKDIIGSNGPKIVESKLQTADGEVEVFETYVPVYQKFKDIKEMETQVKSARGKNPVGYLRYTISLSSLQKAIKTEQESLKKYITDIEGGNKQTLKETTELGVSLKASILTQLGIAIFVLLFGAFFFVRYTSIKITTPVMALIQVAQKISKGEYKQNIDVVTDDEVGILANTFKDMSSAIVKRDEELAELNKGLEKLVEQRTSQLAQEMKKVRNLLDSMRQSVFSINKTGEVVEPVSKFSETIFKTSIAGGKVTELLYKDLDKKSELAVANRTALTTVFDEDDLQWMLMEGNLLREIPLVVDSQKRTLQVNYNPIFDEAGKLEQIMYIVEDVTEERELKRQIEEERKANQEKSQVLTELASQNVEDIGNFFANVFDLAQNAKNLSQQPQSLDGNRAEIFRALHTIKGNAKVYGFEKLGSYVHDVEQYVVGLKDKANSEQIDCDHLQKEILHTQRLITQYCDIAEKVLKIPFKIKALKIKAVHNDLMQNPELDAAAKDRAYYSLEPFFAESEAFTRSDAQWKKLVDWVLHEVIDRGMVFSAKFENTYLKNCSESFVRTVAYCEREINHNKDSAIIEATKGLPAAPELFDDLMALRHVLESTSSFEIKEKIVGLRFATADLKNLLVENINRSPSIYMFVIRAFELVNTYATNHKSIAKVTDPGFIVFEKNWDSISGKLEKLTLPLNLWNPVKECLVTANYVPLRKSLARYFPLVELTSSKLGKKARLIVKGGEAFVPNDKLESLNNALTHLIRNSVDHGIESPEDRARNGKAETGSITVAVFEAGEHVRVEIHDDGKGLSPDYLKKKAIEKGFLKPEQAAKLSDKEAIELIFKSEFSTKDSVSDISGRGVGMDAVKEIVAKDLGGTISLESKPGQGMIVTIEFSKLVHVNNHLKQVA